MMRASGSPVEKGYYLVGMDGSYLTGWQQMGGKWYLLGAGRFDENGLGAGKWNLVLSARGRRDGDRLAEYQTENTIS